jgi:hypothetical protein
MTSLAAQQALRSGGAHPAPPPAETTAAGFTSKGDQS